MKTTKIFYNSSALNITEDFLKKLESIPNRINDTNEYQTSYKTISQDGTSNMYSSLEQLLKCDNSLERSIGVLQILTVSCDDEDEGFYLEIKRNKFYTTKCIVSGEEDYVEIVADELDYQIRRVLKPKLYSVFAKCGVIFTIVFALLILNTYVSFFGVPETIANPVLGTITPVDEFNIWKIYLEDIVISIVLACFLRIPIKKIFPRVVFLFGDGESEQIKKEKLKENIIWNIFVVLLVSIVGGIAIELLISIIP